MKKLQKMMWAAFGIMIFLGCSAEDGEELQMNSLNAVGATTMEPVADITPNDLLGRWELVSMTSDVAVNFDGDSESQVAIMKETPCFNKMYFEFDSEGNVITEQARLFFDSIQGDFTCETTGNYTAKYGISGNELQVTFSVKGYEYTNTRSITRYSEDGSEYLKVTLTEGEVDSAVYVSKGREKTVAKDINEIEFLYIKK